MAGRYRTIITLDADARRDRIAAGVGVALIHVAFALVLLSGLAPRFSQPTVAALRVFDVVPPLPPPPVVEPEPTIKRAAQPDGAAAPPALRALPKPVVAPTPIIPPPRQPITAPTKAAEGTASAAGAASLPGPGTGAGGVGDGLGSGARGSGTGGGGTGARLIRGAIVNRDYPSDARRAKLGGSVTVRFTVTADGRARGCSVMQSSGVATLDATTCRLVEQRFRYAPARDAAGNPIAEERGWRQRWWLEGETPPPGD
ncbi:energy transducer TonB [Sphingomonas oligophenolica]|uniref:Energy transducer TonB n=1 Tax=Sphingomonas oligophenolica TaxID=301154 RepID=A0A502CCL8_9SPHN|nr:energy transducer TonB [Sphingomonas oligophenolica]TPG10907.1 energy transducer TonB [Sphingomonas oligophenolica]